MLGKQNDKYHIIFFANALFIAAVFCTTSVLQFILIPQMKKGKQYNKKKTSRLF